MARTTDGTILNGGFTVSLSTAGIDVIIDSFSINRPGASIFQNDENDEPTAAIHYDGPETGTAQISTTAASSQADLRADEFTTTSMTGASTTYIITASDLSGSKSGLSTGSISFAKKFS